MSEFNQGLLISIVGILITFFALGVFILIMVVLKKLFPYKGAANEGENEDEETYEEPAVILAAESSSNVDEERVAAIGALIYLLGQHSNQLGASLLEGPGRFWSAKQQSKR